MMDCALIGGGWNNGGCVMMDCALIGGGWNNGVDGVSGYGAFRNQGSGYDVMWSQDEYKNSHPPSFILPIPTSLFT